MNKLEFKENDYNQLNEEGQRNNLLNNQLQNPSHNFIKASKEQEPTRVKRKCLSVPRRLFPPHVVTHLESLFDTEKYIKENQIDEIARVTNLNEKQIRSWFKQRRFRYNLENKEKGEF